MVTDQLSWGKYIKRRVSHYTVINIIDHLHGAYLPENSCNMVSGVYTYGRRAIMEVDGVLHSTTLPPSQFVFYGQGPNVPLGKPNSKLFVIIPFLSSSSLLHTACYPSTCAHVQAQMSPMGSGGRGNYSSQSPSLAKRATGLQLRQQQDPIAPCHKNIWPNPMQGLPGGYLAVEDR